MPVNFETEISVETHINVTQSEYAEEIIEETLTEENESELLPEESESPVEPTVEQTETPAEIETEETSEVESVVNETETQDISGYPISMSDECAQKYYALMQSYFNQEKTFGNEFEVIRYYGEYPDSINPYFALMDIDNTGNPELFIKTKPEDDFCDVYTMNNTDYGVTATGYDASSGSIIRFIDQGADVFQYANDLWQITYSIYLPLESPEDLAEYGLVGDPGSISYPDGTVEELTTEKQREVENQLESLSLPELNWIPMNPENVEKYFTK